MDSDSGSARVGVDEDSSPLDAELSSDGSPARLATQSVRRNRCFDSDAKVWVYLIGNPQLPSALHDQGRIDEDILNGSKGFVFFGFVLLQYAPVLNSEESLQVHSDLLTLPKVGDVYILEPAHPPSIFRLSIPSSVRQCSASFRPSIRPAESAVLTIIMISNTTTTTTTETATTTNTTTVITITTRTTTTTTTSLPHDATRSYKYWPRRQRDFRFKMNSAFIYIYSLRRIY